MYKSPADRLRNLALRDWPLEDLRSEVRKRQYAAVEAQEDLRRGLDALAYAERNSR